MPHATTDDGIRLYYEETGTGTPLIFVHEFAGDTHSWELQVRHFARRYRCITFNARGYPPSDVPQTPSQYSQARAADDVRAVLDHLQLTPMSWVCPWEGSQPSTLASGMLIARCLCA